MKHAALPASPVFLGQGSVMQVISTTQGLGYLMKYFFKLNAVTFVDLLSGRLLRKKSALLLPSKGGFISTCKYVRNLKGTQTPNVLLAVIQSYLFICGF